MLLLVLVSAFAPFVVFKVNGTVVPVNATNFGTIFGSWTSGIQISTSGGAPGLTIPASATIEVIVTGIIINPATTNPVTFSWRTATGGGQATENFSATLGTLSLDDINTNTNVKIYPNPFNDLITIDINSTSKIEVYNMIGKLVKTQKIDRGNSLLDMNQFTTGVYIVKIVNENGSIYKKIIKE